MDDGLKPPTARAIARAELTKQIKESARRQLGEVGASSLSVRAVARDLGLASSAVYRYFPGRDELLTALIVDAYSDLASRAETSTSNSRNHSFNKRWLDLANSIRDWALENRHEYELLYGTPVPGYAAPPDTIDPVARLTLAMVSLVNDAVELNEFQNSGTAVRNRSTHAAFNRIREAADSELSDEVLQRTVAAWTQLFGHISFELFGQFHNVVEDYDAFFITQMNEVSSRLTLTA